MADDNDDSDREPPDDGGDDTEGEPRQTSELSIDATLEILASRERRYILSYLADSSEATASTDELVEHIVRAETERMDEMPNRDDLESSLYHIHLPKLTDSGLLEYDPRSQQLRYWGDERLEKWLERVEREEQHS